MVHMKGMIEMGKEMWRNGIKRLTNLDMAAGGPAEKTSKSTELLTRTMVLCKF